MTRDSLRRSSSRYATQINRMLTRRDRDNTEIREAESPTSPENVSSIISPQNTSTTSTTPVEWEHSFNSIAAGCSGIDREGYWTYKSMDCGGSVPDIVPVPDGLLMVATQTRRREGLANGSNGVSASNGHRAPMAEKQAVCPVLSHRMRHDKSILALVVSIDCIYAGTQGGQILVYSLDTYGRKAIIEGHRGSVLGLCLSRDQQLLFSSAGDRIVNVWCTQTYVRIYSIYSTYDVGDIFCVSYSSALQTVYLGAQNTSIQWYDLKEKDYRPRPQPNSHPSFRQDRFFDSPGPGGIRTPRPSSVQSGPRHAQGGQTLEIDKHHIRQFAHYGYVYCMLLARGAGTEDPNEEVLISGGGDGFINVWRLEKKRGGGITPLYKLDDGREEGDSVLSLAVDGSFLYSGRLDGEVNVWDFETKQLIRSLKGDYGDVLSLAVGGGFLFSGSMNGTVEKFNRQYESSGSFQAHNGRVLASTFTTYRGQPLYVTGGNDNTIALWNIRDCITAPVRTTRTSNDHLIESLRQFISYKTVSSDPKYKVDCIEGAAYLKSVLKNFGAVTEMLNTEDSRNPIVFARFRGNPATSANRKRILFYGHYDVIAAKDALGKWICDPFNMEGIDGYLYGRGASDNKGPIMAAIYAVAELAADKALDSDIIFLIEGEEESGSRGFERAVQKNKELIGHIDWILLANSYWLDDHVPCLTYGLRGVIHATVQIESQHPDLHSGVDGSALLDESLKDLVMLLAKLTGTHGKVEIPGFYDPILPLTDQERRLYDDITTALLQRNPSLGDPEALATSLMRRWREASLTIHRFHTSGPENLTIIPRLAKAALSLRLVPNQEAVQVSASLVSFLQNEFANLGSKNKLTVTIDHVAEPWLGDFNNQIFKTLEKAIMHVWGPIHHRRTSSIPPRPSELSGLTPLDNKPTPTTSSTLAGADSDDVDETAQESNAMAQALQSSAKPTSRKPLYIREGGSIPSIRFLEKEFQAPAAHLPCGQASDSAHLDNERLRILNLWKSKDIFKFVFRELPKR